MKNLLIDTNIVIDLLAQRASFYHDAAVLFSLADRNTVQLYVSALTMANTNYVLLKNLSPAEARTTLRKLQILVNIVPLDEKIVELSLNDEYFSDFEDGLQYYTAIEHKADAIITRNLKDFKNSVLPVMTAGQFLATLQK